MDVMERIREASGTVRIPTEGARVLKGECLFSLDTGLSEQGLFTSLSTFLSVGYDFLDLYSDKSGSRVYLQTKLTRVRKEKKDGEKTSMEADSGGVKLDLKEDVFDETYSYSIFLMPQREYVQYPNDGLPDIVQLAAAAVIAAPDIDPSAGMGSADWEEKRPVSKYAKDLIQVDNGKRISPDPTTWKCEDSGMTENLWLNLSDGYIGSGRKNWDGSGGTGAALKHYDETGGLYPLCVKLGTITAYGADVFSYAPDENDMVEDPYLAQHLAHWGINMQIMEKTDKTMAEMEVELNESFEFKHILESDATLAPITGPGLVGLENLGNTCYMNSTLQLMFAIPEIEKSYFSRATDLYKSAPSDPQDDLMSQFAKIGVAILSDRYLDQTVKDKDMEGLFVRPKPRMFKNLIGRGHPEFSTGRQQDALDFFQHLLEKLLKTEHINRERIGGDDTISLFKFILEDRLEDTQSGQVKYQRRSDNVMSLVIPTEEALNREVVMEYEQREKKRAKTKEAGEDVDMEEEEPVKLQVNFSSCIDTYFRPREIQDFTSPVTSKKGPAVQTVKFASFPPYLMVQMMRFQFGEDWTPVKLDALVDVPDTLDLDAYRGSGLQPGEKPLPEVQAASNKIVPDAAIVSQLMDMGFSENGAKRAAIATKNTNAEAGMEWVFQHMEDPDFNDPIVEEEANPSNGQAAINPEHVQNLQAMGFSAVHAEAALGATKGDIERAADWLFSRMDDLDAAVAEAKKESEAPSQATGGSGDEAVKDGKGIYELVGFISHIGKHTQVGHYVAHIRKNGKWILYNDGQVASSMKPPKDLGYLYLYKRVE